jgi:hypothetical protein
MMATAEPGESLTAKLLVAQKSDVERSDSEARDLLIQGLVDRLPKPNDIWSLDDRAKWLRTAASVFDLIYQAGDGEYREINVAFARQETARTA